MSMHFDLVDMQLMVSIGTSRSLTRGAEKSHLSLPAASTRVKNLEAHFGTQLLYRTSQGVTMTPAGESLLRHARTVIGQIEHLRGDMQAFALGVRGRVRVLANTSAMTEFMPAVLGRYLSAHPDVHIELRERLSYLVAKEVSEGAADIGIVAGQPPAADVVYMPYRRDRLVLITPPGHSLAEHGVIAFADTLSFDYVGLSEASAIHPFLRQAADALGRPLKFRVEVGNFEALCRMVEARVGVGVIPASVAERFARTMAFERVALTDSWAERELHICVREYAALPAFAQALVDLLVQDGLGE